MSKHSSGALPRSSRGRRGHPSTDRSRRVGTYARRVVSRPGTRIELSEFSGKHAPALTLTVHGHLVRACRKPADVDGSHVLVYLRDGAHLRDTGVADTRERRSAATCGARSPAHLITVATARMLVS
jgi:hypothetical protein